MTRVHWPKQPNQSYGRQGTHWSWGSHTQEEVRSPAFHSLKFILSITQLRVRRSPQKGLVTSGVNGCWSADWMVLWLAVFWLTFGLEWWSLYSSLVVYREVNWGATSRTTFFIEHVFRYRRSLNICYLSSVSDISKKPRSDFHIFTSDKWFLPVILSPRCYRWAMTCSQLYFDHLPSEVRFTG